LVGHFDVGQARTTLTLADDNRRETYRNVPVGAPSAINDKRRLGNTGYVAEYDILWADRLGLTGAIRHDHNDRFKNADTYRVQASYKLTDALRVRAAAGSGITNPTNFELFGFDPATFVGNPDLKPEKSEGWEVGADLLPGHGPVQAGVTYFRSKLKDEIFTAFTPSFQSTPRNRTDRSFQRGVELNGTAALGGGLTLDANYTWLKATENGGLPEVRRPKTQGSANLSWHDPAGRASATLSVRYTGKFYDFDFTDPSDPSVRRRMDDFTLVNLAGTWKVAKALELFARVENLTGEHYQEAFTFREGGRGVFAGVRAGF
jgi:vitamin B12 transporter